MRFANTCRRFARNLLFTAFLTAQPWPGAAAKGPDQGTLVKAGPEIPLDPAELAPEKTAERGDRRGDRFASWVASREMLYRSADAQGAERLYSGRVYLPTSRLRRAPMAVPLVVYVHGTEAPDQVPLFNRGSEAMVGAMAAYFHNMVVAMPDLPGYGGDPSGRPHPYCHAKSLALAVLDMVRPALELLDPGQLKWDGRVFLVGYSSGGYGALAAVKEWHTNPEYAAIPLTAAACMAGPFHFSESTRAFLTGDRLYQRPDIQAFLLRAYHDLYPQADLFAPERALNPRLLESRADGNIHDWLGRDSGYICRMVRLRLTGKPHHATTARVVMNPDWVEAQLDAPSWPDTEVGHILRENDLVGGWHPRVAMLLATSPTDECVPASNTYALMEDWERRGCRAPVVFYPLTLLGFGLDHSTAASLALEKAFRWIGSGAYAQPDRQLRSRL